MWHDLFWPYKGTRLSRQGVKNIFFNLWILMKRFCGSNYPGWRNINFFMSENVLHIYWKSGAITSYFLFPSSNSFDTNRKFLIEKESVELLILLSLYKKGTRFTLKRERLVNDKFSSQSEITFFLAAHLIIISYKSHSILFAR